jgi:predicted DCC family thiol-disulfide oxidoreductase YuxK
MMADVILVYDKQCPVCDYYCMRIRLQKASGNLVLVDAREHSLILDEITQLGWGIDQGVVVKVGDQLYYAADAIHVLSMMTTPVGLFNLEIASRDRF